jgi:hypothetical protein
MVMGTLGIYTEMAKGPAFENNNSIGYCTDSNLEIKRMNINKENNPTIEQRIERKLQEAEIPGREVEFDPDEAVVGRVNPEQGGVEYRVEFSELGRPPAYDGKTALTIGQRETGISIAGDRTRLCQKTPNSGGTPIPSGGKRQWVKVEVRDQIKC